ncbi:sugar nucleotide-binding protein [Cytobacillus sp. IB215665]|uniref:sugar nucleotide-binding protein n=1 Tax=Cytobacillus sp. IB215665 TaxID=3097357 RepID=UPI002A0E59B4|nr:sugar nucleotide-binding protein [Cytobacillus sp. IB215665]MDX8364571.1 sugar nucleotide-binding protein [Cytobacillus sp. IB215665]
MRIVVLGATGYLGSEIFVQLKKNYIASALYGTSTTKRENFIQLDVIDKENIESVVSHTQPNVVIWPLMSRNDERKLIHTGLNNVLSYMNRDTLFIYLSTDGLFSNGSGNYTEEDQASYLDVRNPMSHYTNAKIDGEQIIRRIHNNHLILRSGPIYGKNTQGQLDHRVAYVLNEISNGNKIERATNIFKTFVHVKDLAIAITKLMMMEHRGTLHVGPEHKESYYSFFQTLINQQDDLIIPYEISEEEAEERAISHSLNTTICNSLLPHVFRKVDSEWLNE